MAIVLRVMQSWLFPLLFFCTTQFINAPAAAIDVAVVVVKAVLAMLNGAIGPQCPRFAAVRFFRCRLPPADSRLRCSCHFTRHCRMAAKPPAFNSLIMNYCHCSWSTSASACGVLAAVHAEAGD